MDADQPGEKLDLSVSGLIVFYVTLRGMKECVLVVGGALCRYMCVCVIFVTPDFHIYICVELLPESFIWL